MNAKDCHVLDVFELLAKAEGWPVPVAEYRFHPKRRWKFDRCWPDPHLKIAVEVEGAVFTQGRHTRGKGYMADMEKYNEAILLGWILIRITPDQAHLLADLLTRAFASRQKQAAA